MPYVEKQIEKIYWTMHDVALMIGVSPSCIRFWCIAFKLQLKRNGHKDRLFTASDIEDLKCIYDLVRVKCLRSDKANTLFREDLSKVGTPMYIA